VTSRSMRSILRRPAVLSSSLKEPPCTTRALMLGLLMLEVAVVRRSGAAFSSGERSTAPTGAWPSPASTARRYEGYISRIMATFAAATKVAICRRKSLLT
jgi:hypothetical protein